MNKKNHMEQEQDNKKREEKRTVIPGMLGKKIGMTRIFDKQGKPVPVTVIKAGPCQITEIKTYSKDGYEALQLGFEDLPKKKTKKPQAVIFEKNKLSPKKFLREIRMSISKDKECELKIGDEIKVNIFKKNEYVDVTGISKGKGFQGGVKRWGWSIGSRSHGSRSYRAPGSIGASADPSKVVKGKHMPGRMGGKKTTIKSLRIIDIHEDENIMLVKGNVPGSKGSYLVIKRSNKAQLK